MPHLDVMERAALPAHAGNADDRSAVRRPRLRLLDGLRLVAALLVVSWHYGGLGHGAARVPSADVPALRPVAVYGWLGVELFFLISGFVICMSAMGRSVGDFARSRFVRLFPAYWFAVLLTALVLTLWPIAVRRASWSDIGMNLTMLQQPFGRPSVDAVYWTLYAELRFYALFAIFVVWRGVTYRRALIFCAVWLAASIALWSSRGPVHDLVLADWAPYFIAGVCLYLLHRFGNRITPWAIVAVCLGLSVRQAEVSADNNARFVDGAVARWPVAVLIVLFYIVMAAIARNRLRAEWRWLSVAGALTYPLYLIHEYIGWTILMAADGLLPEAAEFAIVIGLMLGTAWLMHRYVERPVARWLGAALRRRPDPERGRAPGRRATIPAQVAPQMRGTRPASPMSWTAAGSRSESSPADRARTAGWQSYGP